MTQVTVYFVKGKLTAILSERDEQYCEPALGLKPLFSSVFKKTEVLLNFFSHPTSWISEVHKIQYLWALQKVVWQDSTTNFILL